MASLLGLLVGITSITVSSSPLPILVEQDTKGAEQDDSKEAESLVKAFDAITTSVQVSLEQAFILIDVLPDLEEAHEEFAETDEKAATPNKVLEILFRRIISTNAP